MLDALAEELNQFSETDFINLTLKRKFFTPYFSQYDMRVPLDALESETYTQHFGETYDPDKGEIIDGFDTEYEFIFFLKDELLDVFKCFNDNVYNQCKFEPNEDKKNHFLKFIYLQLRNEILLKIQANDFIKAPHKEVIATVFVDELKQFKKRFNIILGDTRNITKGVKSFKYNSRFFEYNLAQLYSSLKNSGLISETTLKSDFLKVFTNTIISKKISWKGTKSEFYYFITQINSLEDFTNYKSKKWEIASSCFLLLDKKSDELDWRTFRSLKKPSELAIKKIDNYLKL
jgi:hypothetical protein